MKKHYFVKCSELSVYNWRECLNGDLTYMRKEPESKEHTDENDGIAWYYFLSDYYKIIGASDSQMQLMQLKLEHTQAVLNYLTAPEAEKAFYYNAVEWSGDEYEAFIKRSEKQAKVDVLDSLVSVESVLKISIDEKTTSVEKFHKLIKRAQNGKTV
ncbi:MAG: hypothetical protein ACKO96_33405 [Flammeovirgaceae bacterium]